MEGPEKGAARCIEFGAGGIAPPDRRGRGPGRFRTMNPQGSRGLEQAVLLEQVSWIRRLAGELVADRELAEDLVQETCRVALERSPSEPGKLRQWLAEVLRNALRQHARSQGRRLAREVAAARPEALEATYKLVERVLLQREIVNAVLELEEPYRATVLLRFFEELPPREIARRTGDPLATVNSRLQRALARLRERLDDRNRAWAALLLPWVRGIESFGPPTLLTAVMNTKLVLALGAAALAAGALVFWKAPSESERTVPPSLAESPAPADALRGGGSFGAGDEAAEEALPAAREPRAGSPAPARLAEAPSTAEPEEWNVRLRVLDSSGAPLAGIAVCVEGGDQVLGTSGAGGWCVFPTRAERLELEALDPRWVTVHAGSPARSSSIDPVLVLAPAMTLVGTVRDEEGQPLSGANVRFELPDGFLTRFSEVLEASRPLGWRALSGPEGEFTFEHVPAVSGSRLGAVLAGYEREEIDAPEQDESGLELVLLRPRVQLEGSLGGEVLDWNGAPVEGARVGLGVVSVVSDEQGRFEIPLRRALTSETLCAVKAGYLPARLERPGEPDGPHSGWPDRVTLVLTGPALSIRGVVLDHEGHAVDQAKIWLHDPTPTAPIGMMPAFAEPQMAGATIPASALESEARLPEEDGDNFYDWYTDAGEPSALWNWVLTDATGHFELTGLDRRRYKLDVLCPDSLDVATSESFAAGETSAVIRLEAPDLFEEVGGRVLAEDGLPLSGMRVGLFRPMVDVRGRIFGGRSQVVVVQPAGSVVTDDDGRYAFKDVPRQGASLSVRGDGIVPTQVDVHDANQDIPVEMRCHMEIVLLEPVGRFDAISVTDGKGQGLDLLVLTEGSVNAWTSVPLVDGRSGVVSLSSRARVLELYKDGVVVETRALDLLPGDVNRIEL